MFRPTSRVIARAAAMPTVRRAAPTRRFLSTAPPTQKSRSWKSSAARWGIAAAGIYYYNTSDLLAEEPTYAVQAAIPATEEESESYQTIEAISKERQQRKAEAAAKAEVAATQTPSSNSTDASGAQDTASAGGIEGLEEEADQQGAFNPETGEINWDCPCLGGMAHGPCGEEFKAAFSCFVYSTEEPKGMDCIEKFKGMQTCFRQYPEIYGAELEPDDEDADAEQPGLAERDPSEQSHPSELHDESEKVAHPSQPTREQNEHAEAVTEQVRSEHEAASESAELVPKAAHDQRDAPVPSDNKQ